MGARWERPPRTVVSHSAHSQIVSRTPPVRARCGVGMAVPLTAARPGAALFIAARSSGRGPSPLSRQADAPLIDGTNKKRREQTSRPIVVHHRCSPLCNHADAIHPTDVGSRGCPGNAQLMSATGPRDVRDHMAARGGVPIAQDHPLGSLTKMSHRVSEENVAVRTGERYIATRESERSTGRR